jgi:hypothetical protein
VGRLDAKVGQHNGRSHIQTYFQFADVWVDQLQVLKSPIACLIALVGAAVHVIVVTDTRKARFRIRAATQAGIVASTPEVSKQQDQNWQVSSSAKLVVPDPSDCYKDTRP